MQGKSKSWATNMRQKSFRKHLNPRDVNNPLDDYLKKLSLEYEIDKSLLLPWGTLALNGISATAKNYHTHHVYFWDLFPVFGRYGRGTLRIRCSQGKHLELHRILAGCLESGDFVPYEIAIRTECPQVTDAISKIYSKRIATLPSPFSFKLRGYLRRIGAIWNR